MKKKKIVIALGHEALGTTLPEQRQQNALQKRLLILSAMIIR